MFQPTQFLLPVLLQEVNQDGDPDIQSSQLKLLPQSTGLFQPLPANQEKDSVHAMVTLHHSSLTPSLKLLQTPTSQLTQFLLPVPLQEVNQDGDPDIQSSQLKLLPQSTGLFQPLHANQDKD
jgi:hypothetical protein